MCEKKALEKKKSTLYKNDVLDVRGKDTRATWDYLALPGPCAYVVPATKYPKVEGRQVSTLLLQITYSVQKDNTPRR